MKRILSTLISLTLVLGNARNAIVWAAGNIGESGKIAPLSFPGFPVDPTAAQHRKPSSGAQNFVAERTSLERVSLLAPANQASAAVSERPSAVAGQQAAAQESSRGGSTRQTSQAQAKASTIITGKSAEPERETAINTPLAAAPDAAMFDGSRTSLRALSDKARADILRAAGDDYRVLVLQKNFQDGHGPRLLVLMGEVHVKSKQSAEIGKSILSHFDFRGVEGYSPDLEIGHRLKTALHLNWLSDKFDYFTGRILNVLLRRPESSSIDEAQFEALKQEQMALFRAMIASGKPEQMTFIQKLIDDEARVLANERVLLDYTDIKRMLEDFQKGSADDETVAEKKGAVFQLEDGHRPDVPQQMNSLLKLNNLFLIPMIGLTALIPDGGRLQSLVTNVFLFTLCWCVLGMLLRPIFQDYRWFSFLFPEATGVVYGRNVTMSKNIDKAFGETPLMDKMLAIVGMGHNSGMAKMLKESHGFQEIPLSALRQGSSSESK